MGSDPEPLKSDDAIKTYRYLRIGMIGAVVLLTTSIVIERSKVDCWQTSISAYYYTPVRAIFVGSMMAVGLSLIVYKGRRFLEDAFLNFAGMLAPIVAVVPTTDVGTCWSLAPIPRPLQPPDDSLADWVVANIDNNVYALLITGAIGLGIAFVIAMLPRPNIRGLFEDEGTRATTLSLILTGVGLLVALWLIRDWSDFYTLAHGYAAVAMFVLLVLAVIANVWEHRDQRNEMWFWIYAAVATLMILGGIVIPWTRVFGEHTTFALEAYEIAFFAIYWICQTGENWDEKLVGLPPPDPAQGCERWVTERPWGPQRLPAERRSSRNGSAYHVPGCPSRNLVRAAVTPRRSPRMLWTMSNARSRSRVPRSRGSLPDPT